jgi:hypothetical protein
MSATARTPDLIASCEVIVELRLAMGAWLATG